MPCNPYGYWAAGQLIYSLKAILLIRHSRESGNPVKVLSQNGFPLSRE
jgi:hypothetical protein